MKRLVLSSFVLVAFTACASTPGYYFPPDADSESRPAYSAGGRRYLVKKGDSLWRISKNYGVSVRELMEENNIKSARDLEVGCLINIPRSHEGGVRSFLWPVEGEVISCFGESLNNVINRGVNVRVKADDRIKAAAGGRVVFCEHLKGWGQTLILKHPHDFYTIYANLKEQSIKAGRYVQKGEVIGSVAVGRSPIFHFEIRKKHLALDPLKYLK